MNSTIVSRELPPVTTSVDDLLVLWQHPEHRGLRPIGRFRFDGHTYSFDYTRTAQEIVGFRTLPGIREIGRHYESTELFPAFRNRVMTPGRPDYASYLHTLGLDASEQSPWEQIVRSGGGREGDTLQFVQFPTPRDGALDTRFLAHGVRHIPDEPRSLDGRPVVVDMVRHERALDSLTPGERLRLMAQDDNPRSAVATVVAAQDGTPLGYVPEVFAAGIRRLMTAADPVVTVQRINPAGVPPHMRLALRLECAVPEGFSFDPDGGWEPAG